MIIFNFLKKNYGIVLVLILSFWGIRHLFAPGFFPMHDDTQVARVFEMGKALRDGMFPVRWVPDLGYGYGYPIFNFYAPLAYYFGGGLTLFGLDSLIATKIMMIVGILLSGVFMYFLSREFWGEPGGVVSALFYVYAPYHAVDIYVRGDVAEVWAYAFIPLMFWGIYRVFAINIPARRHSGERSHSRIVSDLRDSGQARMTSSIWKWVVVGSLGYAGVILSHNLTAMMITPFVMIAILLYCYIAYRRKKIFIIYHSSLIILFGLLLSSFYWVPALLEMRYTNVISQIGGGADFRDHFVCIQQLWNSQWGFGGSIPGCIDGLSLKIGKLHILAVFIALLITITTGKFFYIFRHSGEVDTSTDSRIPTDLRDSGQARMTVFILLSILGFAISVFMILELSKSVWEAIWPMAFFQYPWRFLLLSSFFSSLLSGFIIWFLQSVMSLRGGTTKQSLFHGIAVLSRQVGIARNDRSSRRLIKYSSFAILIFLLIYPNSKLFQPQTLVLKTSEDYTNEKTLKWFTSKISDEYMPTNFAKPASMFEIANNKISVLEGESNSIVQSHKTNKINGLIDVKKETKLKINIAYFPAWNVFLDGKKIPYTVSNNSLIVLAPEGRHKVDIEFIQTPIEKITNMISLISLIVLFISIIFTRKLHHE